MRVYSLASHTLQTTLRACAAIYIRGQRLLEGGLYSRKYGTSHLVEIRRSIGRSSYPSVGPYLVHISVKYTHSDKHRRSFIELCSSDVISAKRPACLMYYVCTHYAHVRTCILTLPIDPYVCMQAYGYSIV